MPIDKQPHKGSPGRPFPEDPRRGDPDDDTEPGSAIIPCPTSADDRDARPSAMATPFAMAASEPLTDIDEFCQALVDLGLVRTDECAGLVAAIPSSEGVVGLSRALQKAGRLTAYQAAAIHQRKSRGLQIGNYLILDRLGAGGMGVVFKARHRRLGRVVALKMLPPSAARDRSFVQRFKREIEAAARLQHPNIVAALDASEDRGVHYLVMEYVEGQDLYRLVLNRGPLPIASAVDMLIQAARGLEAAHARGIIHRDIKPSNLMVDPAGTVRVLDLGLARLAETPAAFGQTACGPLTGTGIYMGSPDYMAPEQAEDSRRADRRSDIYSLGCSLHFLVTGREPFVGDTLLKRLMAHQLQPAPLLSASRPDVPQALEDAFQKMMAKCPDDRPESMAAVIALLEPIRAARAAPKSPAKLMVIIDGVPAKEPPRPIQDSSIFTQLAGATDPLGGLRHEAEVVDPFAETESPQTPASTAAGPGRTAPGPRKPAGAIQGQGRRYIGLTDPDPLDFTQARLHELWKEAFAAGPTIPTPAARPAGHRHVPIGPYRLVVVPSVRGRAAGQVAIQGMADKQIELAIPAVWHAGRPDRLLLAIWTYSDHSLVIAHLDFQETRRFVLWHAPKGHHLHFVAAADLKRELFALDMEVPDELDTALSP